MSDDLKTVCHHCGLTSCSCGQNVIDGHTKECTSDQNKNLAMAMPLISRLGEGCIYHDAENYAYPINEGATNALMVEAANELICRWQRVHFLQEEITQLKAMALTCCSCRKVLSSLDELKTHIVACPDHPIARYVTAEREACAKIADRMAACAKIANSRADIFVTAENIAKVIRARTTTDHPRQSYKSRMEVIMPKKTPKESFAVSVRLPDGVTKNQMAEYIRNAVRSWKGCFHPDDPLFDLDPESVSVSVLVPTEKAEEWVVPTHY